ncbi:SdpA family antimicrobial peptide system protein [Pyxidicoccus fallax]|uniref:SdpA family antimicrobial peptide system protein n=1 Tax=Pyxidicoccus fallax TaxID=394095 RepID=A0A848L9P5_9BACT|nr:SdpA family antimicrobial peptide system protein [Pyxidicoccus fallax]NMO13575.1 SdpA family antimicrobial peptide system protein [Pyxidicoccus fallax]NPC76717.1 SdpA family antimicrobial peptide system protein [Pyxidicoccus fallax]
MPSDNLAPPEARGLNRLGGVALAVVSAWVIVLAYVAHGFMPYNPFSLPFERYVRASTWAPEGWSFFTRNPQEPDIRLYSRGVDGTWMPSGLTPNSSPANLFGLRRGGRAQGMESALLLEHVAKESWQACEGAPLSCLERMEALPPVHNPTPGPTLCGHVGFVSQKPVPWAWSRATRPVVMPSNVLVMEVSC